MPAELGQHALVWGRVKKKNKARNVNQSGDTRFGLGQLLRARIRPMAGDSPSGYSLTGQSGLSPSLLLGGGPDPPSSRAHWTQLPPLRRRRPPGWSIANPL